jgi:hypothetical protein
MFSIPPSEFLANQRVQEPASTQSQATPATQLQPLMHSTVLPTSPSTSTALQSPPKHPVILSEVCGVSCHKRSRRTPKMPACLRMFSIPPSEFLANQRVEEPASTQSHATPATQPHRSPDLWKTLSRPLRSAKPPIPIIPKQIKPQIACPIYPLQPAILVLVKSKSPCISHAGGFLLPTPLLSIFYR